MTTLLLLGRTGQVGHELLQTLAPLGTVVAPDRSQLDLANIDAIRSVIQGVGPDIIVNAAGFTQVDAAETQPAQAQQVNATAPAVIAAAAKPIGALLVHYSTTFVFDGSKREPYTEDDVPGPLNAYGRSKLEGEQAILACGGHAIIIRAGWTYSSRRSNFVLKMLQLAREQETIAVVDDQIGAPTWARDYAVATAQMLERPAYLREHGGIYNLTASGQCTRYQWAEQIIAGAQALSGQRDGWATLRRTTTADFAVAAPRPLYTTASNRKIRVDLGIELRSWNAGVRDFLHDHFCDRKAQPANSAVLRR